MASAAAPAGVVEAVASDATHRFSKPLRATVTLVAGVGIAGDAHAGATIQHRSRKSRPEPNLRQVHLVHAELLDELADRGFSVRPGSIGENVLTRGVDLLALPNGTRLQLGGEAVVVVTGLRNPCRQLDRFQRGLMAAVLDRDEEGRLLRRAGVMSVVLAGGVVRPGDPIEVRLPAGEHRPLEPV
jgi:MOSC domain-containing protein YiiM